MPTDDSLRLDAISVCGVCSLRRAACERNCDCTAESMPARPSASALSRSSMATKRIKVCSNRLRPAQELDRLTDWWFFISCPECLVDSQIGVLQGITGNRQKFQPEFSEQVRTLSRAERRFRGFGFELSARIRSSGILAVRSQLNRGGNRHGRLAAGLGSFKSTVCCTPREICFAEPIQFDCESPGYSRCLMHIVHIPVGLRCWRFFDANSGGMGQS